MPTPSITPLFMDLERLSSSLRLGSDISQASSVLLEDAVKKARLQFYSALGASRMAELRALSLVADPVTPEQQSRLTAEMCEIVMVRRDLLMTMPTFTMDPHTQQEVWNEDGLVRKMTRKERDESIVRLDQEIAAYLTALDTSGAAAAGLNISVPEGKNPRPGRFVFDAAEVFGTTQDAEDVPPQEFLRP